MLTLERLASYRVALTDVVTVVEVLVVLVWLPELADECADTHLPKALRRLWFVPHELVKDVAPCERSCAAHVFAAFFVEFTWAFRFACVFVVTQVEWCDLPRHSAVACSRA